MKRRGSAAAVLAFLLLSLFVLSVWGTDAELYFSADKSGETRVTKVQEGDQIWIVVYDPDEDIDCDVRDKVWTDVKVMDVKTGAHIVWKSYTDRFGADTDGDGDGDALFGEPDYTPHQGHWPGASAGWQGADFLEETSNTTGLFVSSRPFQIGTRVAFSRDGREQAHIVGPYSSGPQDSVVPSDFQWGGYLYGAMDDDERGDDRVWVRPDQLFAEAAPYPPNPGVAVPRGNAYLPPGISPVVNDDDYMLGRFGNMDTLIGLYVDQNDPGDVALGLAKVVDEESSVVWDREIYRDGNEAATITVTDLDENLNCNKVEMVPVFVIVNPGSWNWAAKPGLASSPSDFCALKRYGGVFDLDGTPFGTDANPARPLEWYNIYDSGVYVDLRAGGSRQPNAEGTYYIDYPTKDDGLPVWFATACETGVTRVMFYATETGADTGVFQLNFNSILRDLGFDALNVRDVLVAYYVDPNDQDDFSLGVSYISERNHSVLRFTDGAREDNELFWLGRDPVYIEVVDANANTDSCCPEKVVVFVCDPHEVDDAEWLVLDELSSNSPVFFTNVGLELVSVWDAWGLGDPGMHGGYSLQLDNWALEAFNEDTIYGRYNDVVYNELSLTEIGDSDTTTAFPPRIDSVRVPNDVSFDTFKIADTQVYDGDTTTMYFLDRQGNRVSGYVNSDCVFVQVNDVDQNEDQARRERVAAFWDGTGGEGQNIPLGPMDLPANHEECGYAEVDTHIINALLGDTNIFDNGMWATLYVLNPRNGRWAPFDLFETGVDSGEFVSVICIDLVNRYDCAPNLGVLPGDTIIAAYQDPSNHSDIAWVSIKVAIGGAGGLNLSTTRFVDEAGQPVNAYIEGEPLYVRVDDPTLDGAGTVQGALTVNGEPYDLAPLAGGGPGVFITSPISLDLRAGDVVEATYVDPTDPQDTSSASVPIVGAALSIERFYAGPSPFAESTAFAYDGQGLAEKISVAVYDVAGHLVWSATADDALSIEWNGTNRRGDLVANGPYIYVISAASGDAHFTGKGTVFVHR